jgi:hypothetical protein
MRDKKLPPITKRGTRRKTRAETNAAIQDAAANIDHHEAIDLSRRLCESHRGYGDRLADGFGMIGESDHAIQSRHLLHGR